jgi:hypothetical protein
MATPSNSATKLGSDADPIRRGLFASQPIHELSQRAPLHEPAGPFAGLVDAARLVAEGRKDEAVALLHGTLDRPNIETRIQLWAWSALRELGVQPDASAAWEVLGVVVEVPMQGAWDTLAAYQDGSARYLNFSGAAIFWDKPDETITALCHALSRSAATAGSQATPRLSVSLPQSGLQLTLLTRSGNYAIADPPDSSIKVAAVLMNELIQRAQTTRQQAKQASE